MTLLEKVMHIVIHNTNVDVMQTVVQSTIVDVMHILIQRLI